MSRELQRYSIINQTAAIHEYASANNFEIVKTYSDSAKSGLTIEGRPGLSNLIADVESGEAEFEVILVFDVSRWGRFQDVDEAAHYEYVCRRAGIDIHYCSETFENDGSPLAALVKNLKRSMAAEYSRELSSKVFAGQVRLTKLGFKAGGPSTYALRRQLVDASGNPKKILRPGEQKYLQSDRVVLVPGPLEEIKVVKYIFQMFVKEGLSQGKIADRLNNRGVPPPTGSRWEGHKVRRILRREYYIGTNVYNKSTQRLRTRQVDLPKEEWVTGRLSFKPIVSPAVFRKAQTKFRRSKTKLNEEEALQRLRELLKKEGKLSGELIDATPDMPPRTAYYKFFGSLSAAYELAGYTGYAESRYRHYARLQRLRNSMAEGLVELAHHHGIAAKIRNKTSIVRVNSRFNVHPIATRIRKRSSRSDYWSFPFVHCAEGDFVLGACMNKTADVTQHQFIFPQAHFSSHTRIQMSDVTLARNERYRVREPEDVLRKLFEFDELGGSNHGIALMLAVGNLSGWKDRQSRIRPKGKIS